MSKRGVKSISRIRAGGVVLSKKRTDRDPNDASILSKKHRIAGLPNRKAAQPKAR